MYLQKFLSYIKSHPVLSLIVIIILFFSVWNYIGMISDNIRDKRLLREYRQKEKQTDQLIIAWKDSLQSSRDSSTRWKLQYKVLVKNQSKELKDENNRINDLSLDSLRAELSRIQ